MIAYGLPDGQVDAGVAVHQDQPELAAEGNARNGVANIDRLSLFSKTEQLLDQLVAIVDPHLPKHMA